MTDTHDGVKIKAGLYQREDGSLTMCLLELLRSPEFRGKPHGALGQLVQWATEAEAKGYRYAGAAEPFHLHYLAPIPKGVAK